MFQLTFNQKVGLGFAIIISLLLVSGLSSLWNLNDINGSTSRVNETAVPVVKQSNDVQIQLLKLAKLSSLAFNASDQNQINAYIEEFTKGTKSFDDRYLALEALADTDDQMKSLAIGIKSNYDAYSFAVNEMFEAKTEVLTARDNMLVEAETLFGLADDVGASLVEIQYFGAPEDKIEEMTLITGFTESADNINSSIFKTIDEIKITQDIERVSDGMGDFEFSLNDSKRWFDKATDYFASFDSDGMIDISESAYEALYAYMKVTPSIVDHKKKQLEQIIIAKVKLDEADAAVTQSISGLDELLKSADDQFNILQGEVSDTLAFGFKSSIVMLVILLI